jgi:hypothetical protein
MLRDKDASRRQRSSVRAAVAPWWRDRRLDYSKRNPRATAEVPAVPGGIRGGLDRNRAFVLGCDTLASGTCDSMRRIDFIPGGKKHAPPRSQIWSARKNIEEGNMLRDSEAFSGFSAEDIPNILYVIEECAKP